MSTITRLAGLCCGLAFSATAFSAAISFPQTFSPGWNLAGNSLVAAIDVKGAFGAAPGVQTVWKWNAVTSRWAFYAPALDVDGTLASYAANKGYDRLTSIYAGEGYWVNVSGSEPVARSQQSGEGVVMSADQLQQGWNLVAMGDDLSAAALSAKLGNVTSLWSWDASSKNWRFYSPALAASNGLASYIQSKDYQDFGALGVGNGQGIWINRTTPGSIASTLVTAPTPTTYAAGSEELAAFNYLNNARSSCGFGLLKQSAALDVSARGHADWLLINFYTGHYQSTGTTGFTGVSHIDRMVAASYGPRGTFDPSEVEVDAVGNKTGRGVNGVRGLLNAPYHLLGMLGMLGMLGGYRDVGISVRDKSDVSSSLYYRNVLNIDVAALNSMGRQASASGAVRTYPCNGTTGADRSMRGENPSPVVATGRNLGTNPIGTSIGVAVDVGSTLIITSASMVNANTNETVTLLAPITGSTDPNKVNGVSYIGVNEGFVSADKPLLANTPYRAIINGTSNGVAFTRTIVFTTGE